LVRLQRQERVGAIGYHCCLGVRRSQIRESAAFRRRCLSWRLEWWFWRREKAVWESWEYVSGEIRTKETNDLQCKRLRWIKKERGSQWRSWQCAATDKPKTTRSATDPSAPIYCIWFCSLALFLRLTQWHQTRQATKHQPSRNDFSKSSRCSSFIPEVLYHLLRGKWSVNFALIYDSRALEGSFIIYIEECLESSRRLVFGRTTILYHLHGVTSSPRRISLAFSPGNSSHLVVLARSILHFPTTLSNVMIVKDWSWDCRSKLSNHMRWWSC